MENKFNHIIVLPGLDGTVDLLQTFKKIVAGSMTDKGQQIQIWPLPDDPTMGYFELLDFFAEKLQQLDSVYLIAESFSGPLGILLAHRCPKIVQQLGLVATFAKRPGPLVARLIPWSLVFRLPMPRWMAGWLLTGNDQTNIFNQLQKAVARHSPQTLARRMNEVLNVDVREQLSGIICPVIYLQGKQDRLVGRSAAATILKTLPSVSPKMIDGPHLILQTKPEQAWSLLHPGRP